MAITNVSIDRSCAVIIQRHGRVLVGCTCWDLWRICWWHYARRWREYPQWWEQIACPPPPLLGSVCTSIQCVVGRLEKHTIKLILFQKPRVGHLLIYRKHKECPVVQITKYRSSPFAHTIQIAHLRSRTTLYICRLPAKRMHTVGAALYGSARHKWHGQ